MSAGVLQRAQGRGTFVHPRYLEREKTTCDLRVGLVFNRHASVGDYYHGRSAALRTLAETTQSATRATDGADLKPCGEAGIKIPPSHVVRVPRLWLDDKHLRGFDRALNDSVRPTALFTAGYTLALQGYSALMARAARAAGFFGHRRR